MSSAPGPQPLVTLHLFGVHGTGVARALVRMARDRPILARTPGLAFWKLLGTGDGRTFRARDADLGRWGLFGVWHDDTALARFEAESPVTRAWGAIADERWRAELLPARWKGSWAGRDPFSGAVPVPVAAGDGRVAVLTRARIRPQQWRSFQRAVPAVAASSVRAAGRTFAIGIGEAPIGLQATFSMWQGEGVLDAFAYRGAAHRDVIRRTRSERWYGEELFARFAVRATSGTVDGATL